MGNKLPLAVLFLGILGMVLVAAVSAYSPEPVALKYPESWPTPTYDFTKNPLTKQGIELGRRLFYDPILSKDSTISCSSCHLSYTAFTHVDHDLSHGIADRIGTRNSPVLMNLAWVSSFMWDGAVNHLDMQALAPISSPVEMDETIENVVKKVQRSSPYPSLFYHAFGDSTVTGEHLLKAMAQFELTLVSANSKYDQVKRGEAAFTGQENNGYMLFQKNCARCHAEPFFTNHDFEKNGLPLDTTLHDFGRMVITQLPTDSLKFKVPTLRNIEFSYPYMHDGRFRKLGDVMKHYTQSSQLNIELSSNEKVDLTAFLLTLTDKEFLFNPDFAFPRN
ncbi:MAG: cytochrome-c peroxidase [Saprospiraceae bacterium]|nr:cytochrome-c peroxidase [Saprospiraceae bacterium]MCF8252016.1 cytochrome-c peroxidase [Saprospiraceae bacterium]MCF8281705.1 cytochrome-c peroxidase [Bacteroidales bacterium]MCF8313693.1 cytochrome-c peroxidase [Saprospiraceae bacterium]MCF8442400.1 cytochrome-c peroxidase [Saprospiraceae bacterium]